MYDYDYFVEHDYHILEKATYRISFSKNFCKWIETIRFNDPDIEDVVTIYDNSEDAYKSYRESMQSYGFKKFKIISGKY